MSQMHKLPTMWALVDKTTKVVKGVQFSRAKARAVKTSNQKIVKYVPQDHS